MNTEQFFEKFFEGDRCKYETFELDDNLIIEKKDQFEQIQPFIGLISFINPSHRIIFKKVNLVGVEIDNPAIGLEFNNYLSISQLDISKINVKCVYFVNCKLLPPDFTITFNNIVIDNTELLGVMNIKTNSITFLNNNSIFGSVIISGNVIILNPIKISDIHTQRENIEGKLIIQ